MSDKTALKVAIKEIIDVFDVDYYGKYGKDRVHSGEDYRLAELILSISFTHNSRKCRVGVYYEGGELPKNPYPDSGEQLGWDITTGFKNEGYWQSQKDMLKAGYKQVIKEPK